MKTGLLTPRPLDSGSDSAHGQSSPSSSSSSSTSMPRYSQSDIPVSSHASASRSLSEESDAVAGEVATGEGSTTAGGSASGATNTSSSTGTPPESGTADSESTSEGTAEESAATEENTGDSEEAGGEGDSEISADGASEEVAAEGEGGELEADEGAGEEAGGDVGPEGGPSIGPASGAKSEGSPVTPLAAALPRMARIQTPYVANPPRQAMERRDEIIKRTGAPPELNHAQVRQAAQTVTQAARDNQRQMISEIGYKAFKTRISIECMAEEVWDTALSAISSIHTRVNSSLTEIEQNAEGEIQHIKDEHVKSGEGVQAERDARVVDVYQSLKGTSEKIQQAEDIAMARFDAKVPTADGYVRAIPESGQVGRIALKDEGGGFGDNASSDDHGQQVVGAGEDPGGPQAAAPGPTAEGAGEEPANEYKVIADAQGQADGFLIREAGVLAEGYTNLDRYYQARSRPHLEGHAERQQRDLVTAAAGAATRMAAPASRAQFMTMVLGLTTPVSEHHDKDQTQTLDTQTHRNDEELAALDYADAQAVFTLRQKRDMAKQYSDIDLREKLTKNVRKQGKKGRDELNKQAIQTEIKLNTTAAVLAEDYVDLIHRLDTLLEPGKFYNAQELVPQILLARESAKAMLANNLATTDAQAEANKTSMKELKDKQIEGLGKTLESALEGIGQIVTRSHFDMSMFSSMMTGEMSDGAAACRLEARAYAEEMTKGILSTNERVRGEAMNQIENAAAGFFNGVIGNTESAQFRALSNFVDMMQGTAENSPNTNNGPLVSAMVDAQGIIDGRASQLDACTRGPSAEGLAVGAAVTYACPIVGGIGTAVYLYQSDPDDDQVLSLLGDIAWPGVPAIGDMFTKRGFGDLENRIDQKISEPQRATALGLFSESEAVRGYWRAYGIENSTGWFDISRGAREALGQGMSEGEHQALERFAPERLASAKETILGDLEGHEEHIALAYLENNQERAIAATTEEALDKAEDEGTWGFIFSAEEAQNRSDRARINAIDNIDVLIRQHETRHSVFVNDESMNATRDTVFQEYASLTDPANRSADQFDAEDGRAALIRDATQSHNTYVIGALTVNRQQVSMSEDASQYVNDAVNLGVSSDEARDSRAVFEFNEAKNHSMFGLGLVEELPESTQMHLTNTFENPTLDGLQSQLDEIQREIDGTTDPEQLDDLLDRQRGLQAQYDSEETKHQAKMLRVLQRLEPDTDITTGPAAQERMAELVGDLFALEDSSITTPNGYSHSTYGEQMIMGGRASLEAGAALATEGAGTHEDLLRRSYQNRSEEEYDQAREWWGENYHEDMDVAMGIKDREWETDDYVAFGLSPAAWFMMRGAETSGDLASELRLTVDNERKTDLDNLRYANGRHQEDRVRGTGVLAEIGMEGSQSQTNLDGDRTRMARLVIEEAERRQPGSTAQYGDDPTAIFRADGSIDPAIEAIAFEDGNFRGSRTLFAGATRSVSASADAYRADIARQESILTTTIALVALVVTVVAMLIPGVNAVAAGVAVAIVSGIATMGVKAGMRGDRYGWEEAATDVAMTAIEAGSAGLGGALGKVSAFAKLGRVGGAVAREAISGAITAGAQVALQDETWKDGFGRGLEVLAGGALKQAAIQGVSAGVSEGISGRLTRAFSGSLDASGVTRAQRAASAMGPHKTSAVTEAVSELFGSVAGESVGLAIDNANGKFKGNFGDVLKHLGMNAVRDMAIGGLRGAVNSVNKQRYRHLLDAARQSGTVSESQLSALRLAGISAGEIQYGQDINHMRSEVESGRHHLSRIPQELREQAMSLDAESLKTLVQVIDSGGFTQGKFRDNFIHGAFENVPGFDSRKFLQSVNEVATGQKAGRSGETPDADTSSKIRSRLGEGLEPRFKMAMEDIDIAGLQHLSSQDLRALADMVAIGELKPELADALFRKAKQADAEINESNFLGSLYRAVESANQAKELDKILKAKAHAGVMEMLPRRGRGIVAGLPEDGIMTLKRLMDARDSGSAMERDFLFGMALESNPKLARSDFDRTIDSGIATARQKHNKLNETTRRQRERHLSFAPEADRRLLSELPPHALIELRIQQQRGGELDPIIHQDLINAALKLNPDLDVEALSAALHKTVATPTEPVSSDRMAQMRSELEAGLPPDKKAYLDGVPILVMSDSEFEAFTRSAKGQAVTLILHGRPVVVMREGADPTVLREEGIHVLQSKDPAWKDKVGALDESLLANWDQLPIAQQIILYKNKLDIEIDAQKRLLTHLESDISGTDDPNLRGQLQSRLALTEASLVNLVHRSREVHSLSEMHVMAMTAGTLKKPQWLDQPSRLFNKGDGKQRNNTEPIREEISRYSKEFIEEYLTDGIPPAEAKALRLLVQDVPLASLRVIVEFSESSDQMRKLIENFGSFSDKGLDSPLGRLNELANNLKKLDRKHAQNIVTQLGALSKKHTFNKYVHGILALGALRLPDSAYRRLLGAAMGTGANANTLVSANLKLVLDTVFPREDGPEIKRSDLLKLLRLQVNADGDVTRKLMRVLQESSNANQTLSRILAAAQRLGPNNSSDLLKFIGLGNNPTSALKIIDDLYKLHKNTPNHETYYNFFAMLHLSESSGNRMLEKLVDLTSRLDPQGRRALSVFMETTDQSGHVEFIETFTLLHENVLKNIQADLLPGQEGRLLNLIIEMASTRTQWNVFMKHAKNFFTMLHALRSSDVLTDVVIKEGENGQPDETVNGVQAILAHITKTKQPGANDDDRQATLDQLAADITAASKQFYNKSADGTSPVLHAEADRPGLLAGQVKTLALTGVMAGKDAWREKLANAAPNWKNMEVNDATRHFADLLKDTFPHLNNSEFHGQLALMMELKPWFDQLAKLHGLDPKSSDPDVQKRLMDMLKPLISSGLVGANKDIRSPASFAALMRVFKEETVRVSREEKGVGGVGDTDAQIKERMTNDLLARMNVPNIEALRSRADGEHLVQHINTLVERMMKYQEMERLAGILPGAKKAGISQNVTEVIGEIALTLRMLDGDSNMLLAMPFGKGTGFDQVWILTDNGKLDGNIIEVVIGEAKGPNADLGNPDKGPQMSLRWVTKTLNEMAVSKDKATRELAYRLIEAAGLQNGGNPPKYTGLVIEAVEQTGTPATPTPSSANAGSNQGQKPFTIGQPPRTFVAEDKTIDGRGRDGYEFESNTLKELSDIDIKGNP